MPSCLFSLIRIHIRTARTLRQALLDAVGMLAGASAQRSAVAARKRAERRAHEYRHAEHGRNGGPMHLRRLRRAGKETR